ncbi:MAG: ABC transporter ATP-binding protein [Chloroflexi bacterium]|nr:ABC transporter ATP-binding protein [Chloroflexota bacterium]
MALIEALHLVRSYGRSTAVDDISFFVSSGEIYGLVGSDGAGKTTTLRLLVGALRPNSGTVHICGFEIQKNTEQAREKIGYLSQRFSLYEDLTVLENIRFFAEIRGLERNLWKSRCMELLHLVGLENFTTRKSGQLSGGMKQKLGLASALISQPQILLLDEPTTGVDPLTRQDFWQLILRIVAHEKMAVVITTPYMDEAERCHRLGFMRTGKIIAEGTPAQLKNNLADRILEIRSGSPLKIRGGILLLPGVEDAQAFGDKLHVRCTHEATQPVLDLLLNQFECEKGLITSVRVIPPTLEDVFISLSNQSLGSRGAHA